MRDLRDLMPHAVYRAFGAQAWLLYVGISVDPHVRLAAHNRRAEWADEARHITLAWYGDRRRAEAAEARAIVTEHPVYNITNSWCWCGRGAGICGVCALGRSPAGRPWPIEHDCPSVWMTRGRDRAWIVPLPPAPVPSWDEQEEHTRLGRDIWADPAMAAALQEGAEVAAAFSKAIRERR
jgi:predicted GIY-YIG superfamily endonuclease